MDRVVLVVWLGNNCKDPRKTPIMLCGLSTLLPRLLASLNYIARKLIRFDEIGLLALLKRSYSDLILVLVKNIDETATAQAYEIATLMFAKIVKMASRNPVLSAKVRSAIPFLDRKLCN